MAKRDKNMLILLLFLYPSLIVASVARCAEKNSVDLSNAKLIHDGTLVKDNVRFPPDYVFTKNISGEEKKYGCLCELRNCFRKCCPLGKVLFKSNGTKSCIKSNDTLQLNGLNVSNKDNFTRNVRLEGDEFSLIYGLPCNGSVYLEREKWFVQEVGAYPYFIGISIRRDRPVDETCASKLGIHITFS